MRGVGQPVNLEHHLVYEVVPVEQCYRDTGRRPVSARWLDIKKGDSNRMELRSRFVAREIKSIQDRAGFARDDVFSALHCTEQFVCW